MDINSSANPSMMRNRDGFSLMELLVVVTAFTLLLALALPAFIYPAREESRKAACSRNLAKIGSAMLQYEQTYKRFTSLNCTWGYGGYAGIDFWNVAPGYGGAGRWSGMIALLPYLNEDPLYQSFHEGTSGMWGNQSVAWGPYGSIATAQEAARARSRPDVLRYAWSGEYKPNRMQVSVLRCPSDPGRMRSDTLWNLARTNYAFCLGDSQIGLNCGDPAVELSRGPFALNKHYTISEITDGASNTLMFGEVTTAEGSAFAMENQGTTEKDAKVQGRAIYELDHQPDLKGIDVYACRALAAGGRYPGTKRNWGNRGARAYDSLPVYIGFSTINPPNAASCTPTSNAWGEGEGIYTAGSYHLGGAHLMIFDGGVRFFADGLNTNDWRPSITEADYYSPGRTWSDGKWHETPNWKKESPFGFWGGCGTRASNDYPIDGHVSRP